MSCESITLADGSQVLVNVKPGKKLLPEDIAALSEFYSILRMAGPQQPEPGVDGYPIGGQTRASRR